MMSIGWLRRTIWWLVSTCTSRPLVRDALFVLSCHSYPILAPKANAFWSKPFPTGRRLVRELMKLPIPLYWRVLIADDQVFATFNHAMH